MSYIKLSFTALENCPNLYRIFTTLYRGLTESILLFLHLLHTVALLPSSAISGYNTLILFVLQTGHVPLPWDGKFHNVLPLWGFNAILFHSFLRKVVSSR